MKNFNCSCCGDCCSGEMTIRLNHYDLYKIGKHFNLYNSKELFDRGLIKLKLGQNNVQIPTINFKINPYKFCPFLINDINENNILKGFCSLHPYIKPLVCILSPYSREYDSLSNNTIFFNTKPTETCPGTYSMKETQFSCAVAKEIENENWFYSTLESILNNKTKNYSDTLYYFSISEPYSKIKNNIELLLNQKNYYLDKKS